MADPLSRENGLDAFLIEVQRRAFVVPPAVLEGMPNAGRVRNLDMSAPFNAADMEALQVQSGLADRTNGRPHGGVLAGG